MTKNEPENANSEGAPPDEQADDRNPTAQVTPKNDHEKLRMSRRNVLTATIAGMLTASGAAAEGVAAAGGGSIDVFFNDAWGANEHGKPDMFAISDSSDTEIEVSWNDLVSGQQLFVRLSVRPEGGSSETLGEVGFVVESSSGSRIITPSDYTEEERDLTTHSEISLSDFHIPKDLDYLATKDNRTITRSYWLEVLVETSNEVLAQSEDKFNATFGLSAGAGINFGYNFGKWAPTATFENNY